MTTTNELALRTKRLAADILDMKHNQTIGGDSWVVYRTELNFTKEPGMINVITFVPDIANDFVALAVYTTPDRTIWGIDQDITPDPNVNGKWYDCTFVFGSSDRTIFIYSTVKGTAFITDYTAPITA